MKFDFTVSVGNLLYLAVLIGALWRFSLVITTRFTKMESQIDELMGMRPMVESCQRATDQLRVQVQAMWDWFTNNLERRSRQE